jgi:hypothetical protein
VWFGEGEVIKVLGLQLRFAFSDCQKRKDISVKLTKEKPEACPGQDRGRVECLKGDTIKREGA